MKKRIVIKRKVICKSGLKGWQDRLKNVYNSLDDFQYHNEHYGIARRLGFETAMAAWKANPIVRGSTLPSDYERRTLRNYDKPSRRA